MATFKVKALYDFHGEPNSAEMTINMGEIITVTRTDVGEGWWEGVNSQGVSGLFPEAYVEKVASGPPSLPPPILPESDPFLPNSNSTNNTNVQEEQWDDDWDEDVYQDIQGNSQQSEQLYANEPNQYFNNHGPDGDSVSDLNLGADNKGTITKKSLNRFSTFVKSGGESYILGTLKINVSDQNKIRITKLDESTFTWPSLMQTYSVLVTSPKKESKLKGLKHFIAYQLTPSFNNIQVSRRYKHFDWLHERLTEKFSLIAVPPLPDKQISGRYEEQFIEHRRAQLQEFVDYVCRHPVLSISEVWTHFLTCTDEKLWKMGKRQAEKDQLVGANFCLCIEAPERNLLQSWVDDRMETQSNFIHNLDTAVKNLLVTSVEQTKKHQQAKRDFSKVGESFYSLGTAIESADKALPSDLATGAKRIGTAYFDIGKLYEDQPKIDWEPLSDKLYLYKGILGSFPDIFSIHKGAQQKRKESEKFNMNPAQLLEVRKRTDTLTYAIFSELEHFKSERDIDLKQAMKRYLLEQVNFYKNIVLKLEDTLQFFEE